MIFSHGRILFFIMSCAAGGLRRFGFLFQTNNKVDGVELCYVWALGTYVFG